VAAGGAEANVVGGFAVEVEGRRASLLSIVTFGIGGSTGGPIPVPVPVPVPDLATPPIAELGNTGTGISVGTGAVTEAGSVRLIRSPEISSSCTASHAQRMSRAHSSTSG